MQDGLAILDDCSSTPVHAALTELFDKFDVNEFAASVKVYAIKK
jgi:hypothetical protein